MGWLTDDAMTPLYIMMPPLYIIKVGSELKIVSLARLGYKFSVEVPRNSSLFCCVNRKR